MRNRGVFLTGIALALLPLAGCGGGGGGSSSTPAPTGKALTTELSVASLRNSRAVLALTGLGLKATTRAATVRMGSRAALLLLALRSPRATTVQGYDADTLLYYTITTQSNGSGSQALFTDSARTQSAGSFVWGVPQWHNSVTNSYPAVYQISYNITAGEFAGDHGTLAITLDDMLGNTGFLHLLNFNNHGEGCNGSITITNALLSAVAKISLAGGITCNEIDTMQADGTMTCDYTFSDGYSETATMQPDGTGDETLTAPGGSTPATGDFNSDGMDDIQYDDGSSEDVNVDTGDSDDSGDSGDSGDSSNARRSLRR